MATIVVRSVDPAWPPEITFADEPHFRLFWRATLPMFLNAVTYSPTFSR